MPTILVWSSNKFERFPTSINCLEASQSLLRLRQAYSALEYLYANVLLDKRESEAMRMSRPCLTTMLAALLSCSPYRQPFNCFVSMIPYSESVTNH
jgi:hypothetical protein